MGRKQSLAVEVIKGWNGQSVTYLDEQCLDLVITSATVIDHTGIYKADIGIKDGKIAGIGKAGNPHIMDGVDPDMIVGSSTEALAGEGMILTAEELIRIFILFLQRRFIQHYTVE